MFEGMPLFFQVLANGLGLLFLVVIAFALLYIADEFEESAVWPVGRIIKALIGGLMWAIVGVVVAAGLFAIGVVIRAIFFRPVFSFYIYQFWAFRIGLGMVGLYLLWGIYHGAKNKLPLSFRYRRHADANQLNA